MLTVIVLTYNEEIHIGRCLASVEPVAEKIVVVDSYSTDRTIEIARSMGAIVLQNPFRTQSDQFRWALENVQIDSPWIMRIDADEIIGADLVAEIQLKLPQFGPDIVGINLKRKHIFMNKWIRHGGRYPVTLLRLWRTGHGRVENRFMDEHMIVWGGNTVVFEGEFADWNLNDLTYFTDKHNKYATREAIEVLNQKYGLFERDSALNATSASTNAFAKRWIKEKIYNRLPFWFGPLVYFLFRFFVQLGFLDGRPGLIYHFLQGFWYRFLVGSKVVELEMHLDVMATNELRIRALETLTGYRF